MAVRQYVGARYVPKFYEFNNGVWQSNTEYEPLTIVQYNGNSYTSKKSVPANIGNPSENNEYWVATGNYNAQVEAYRQEVASLAETLEDTTDTANNANNKVNALNPVIASCTFNTGIGATNYFARLVKIGRIVFVMCQFKLGNQVSGGTNIYTLPNGFIPATADQIICNSPDNTSQMNVTTDGHLALGATQQANEYTCVGFYHLN